VLGFLDPDIFSVGGSHWMLRVPPAALGLVGAPLGLDAKQTAAARFRLSTARWLIRSG
jgi:hypothetical protein